LNKFIAAIIPAVKLNKNIIPSRAMIPTRIKAFSLLKIMIEALMLMEYRNFQNMQKWLVGVGAPVQLLIPGCWRL